MESLNLILDTYGLFSQKNCEKFDFSFEEYLPENYYKNISKEITVVLTTGTKMFYENNQTFIYFTAKDMDSKFCLSINSKFYSLTKSNFWKHFSFPILNEKKQKY